MISFAVVLPSIKFLSPKLKYEYVHIKLKTHGKLCFKIFNEEGFGIAFISGTTIWLTIWKSLVVMNEWTTYKVPVAEYIKW